MKYEGAWLLIEGYGGKTSKDYFLQYEVKKNLQSLLAGDCSARR